MTKKSNIRVVTRDEKRFIELGWETFADLEESLDYCDYLEYVGADLETYEMSPWLGEAFSLQIGNADVAFVIDLETIPLKELKSSLEEWKLIFQNGAFDIPFLFKEGIVPKFIYDTLIAEKVLTLGLRRDRRLGALVKKYKNVELDKGYQSYISNGFVEPEGIEYAGLDVIHLHDIMKKQMSLIKTRGLEKKLKLENEFVHVASYMEHCGVYLDKDQWLKRVRKIEYEEYGAWLKLNQYLIENYPDFSDSEDPYEETINWDSPLQVAGLFKEMEIDIVDPKTKKESVKESVIVRQKDKHDIVPLYIDYKHKAKAVSTYGRNWLDYPMSDGRIHTKLNSLVSTGRTSCGNVKKGPFPNTQNINKSSSDRKCFKAQGQYVFCALDYSGQESIILADRSKEPRLLEFYQKGEGDLHWFVAQQIWPELQGHEYDEDNKIHKEKRQSAKAANFAVAYGGNGATIAANLNIDDDIGWRVYNAYMDAFPDLSRYFDEQERLALKRGYVLMNEVTQGKRFIEDYRPFMEEYRDRDFWSRYKIEKKKDSEEYKNVLLPKCRRLMAKKNEIRKMALNSPCQGTGADMAKEAGVEIYKWIIDNKLFDKVKIVIFVHDEWVLEMHTRSAERLSHEVREIMENTANKYLNILTMEAEPKITKHWTK